MELPPGFWSEEPTALLCLFLRRLRLFRLGVRFALLPRRDATASAILFLGQWNHLLSSVLFFAVRARRHPQMHCLAKSVGSRYTWKLFSAIRTIRSWSFFLPS